jgi:hypothetical protein
VRLHGCAKVRQKRLLLEELWYVWQLVLDDLQVTHWTLVGLRCRS